MDMGLTGKRALVLGASGGLGRAIAQGLAAEGAHVIAAARNVDAIEVWARDMPNTTITSAAIDLSDFASIDKLMERLLAEGGVDVLVNNSGGPPPGTALTVGRKDWNYHFETMATSLFHLTAKLVPAMQLRGWGRVITIVSSGVEQPIPNLALSNGIRSAVVGWSKTLAGEVAPHGVTVNIVMPGRIHTQRVDQLDAAAAERTQTPVERIAAASVASIPAGRYGRPQEFADVVVFLASERASYVTGSRLRVDGGSIRSV